MKNKIVGGAIALIVGGFWAMNGYQGFDMAGIRAIGIPLLIALVGFNLLYKGVRGDR